jgi:DNA-binding PadR family transcriptional regulator
LYPAVERLMRAGLIEPSETERAGRRPERTVYRLTEEGRDTANSWLTTMLRTVKNEFPEFPAALSFIPVMSVDDARDSLLARLLGLRKEIAAMRALAADLTEKYELPRLFAIEDEYKLAMLEAEHAWVSGILDDLARGELHWDNATIRDWAQGLRDRMGSFPGIARTAGTDADLPP